jgi:RHS repeat-associated protein
MTWTNVNSDNFTLKLTYDGNGRLLSKELLKNDVPIDTIEYMGGIQYDGGKLDVISVPQGRAIPTCNGEFRYDYYYTDHLGNIRLWYSDLNGDGEIKVQSDGTITHCNDEQTSNGEILQEQHYYPYGLTMGGLNYTSDVLTTLSYGRDPHLYTAKELTKRDLNLYNFGARWYDMSLGRWMVHDPAYQFASPYLAMGNNPVSFIDPDGESVILTAMAIGAVIGGTFGGIKASSNPNVTIAGGVLRGAFVGAVGGALSTVGGGTFVANVAWGVGQGAFTGGLDAVVWGNEEIGMTMLKGAIVGGAFATLTSGIESIKNASEGYGFGTNEGRLRALLKSKNMEKLSGFMNDRYGIDANLMHSKTLDKYNVGREWKNKVFGQADCEWNLIKLSRESLEDPNLFKTTVVHEYGHLKFDFNYANEFIGGIDGSEFAKDGVNGYFNELRNAGRLHASIRSKYSFLNTNEWSFVKKAFTNKTGNSYFFYALPQRFNYKVIMQNFR